MRHNAEAKVNSEFHHIAGKDLFEPNGPAFKEYRENWKKWPEAFRVGGFPLFIDIEATNVCNLRCPFCAITARRGAIKNSFISLGLVKKIVDEGADMGLCGVKFNIRGEPLMHKEIDKFVAYAKKKGLIDVYFNTNAALLSEEMAKRLIDAGLDRLSISFEGHTKDVYERYRVGARYDTVLRNIEKLLDIRKAIGVQYPKVRVQTVLVPEVKSAINEYKKFWLDRVDEVAFLDHRETTARRTDIRSSWACQQLWQRMAVWCDGTIFACNQDDDGLNPLGNASELTIEECWHSEKLGRMRDAHKNGVAQTIAVCNGCYLRDNEIMKLKK